MAVFTVVNALLALCLCSLVALACVVLGLPAILRLEGDRLRQGSHARRQLLLSNAARERRIHADDDQGEPLPLSSIVGFFHPFCNAGGGGERVLWEAIRATQQRWPQALCVVYTGDHDVDKAQMLQKVRDRFNIDLYPPQVNFLYLTKRHLVLSNTWPRFTLLGQSIGSMVLGWEAFGLLVPDVFVDTMGYAFAVWLSKALFPRVPTGAYVHYPTISTDMLDSLDSGGQGIHQGAGDGFHGTVKRAYWDLFAKLYCRVGSSIDVVMTNSTWTQSHIKSLWGPYRRDHSSTTATPDIDVVFPPVAVQEIVDAVAITKASEKKRKPYLLYIAQFRPEKNHELVLRAFSDFVKSKPSLPTYGKEKPRLILIGSVRESDEKRIYQLRLLARELKIDGQVEFVCDAKWPEMLNWMAKASVGVNAMWSEHFGIGVVEYQAAGLISVVNDSGGPKLDIVIDIDGKPTGFHASTTEEYTSAFLKALTLSPEETLAMRLRARESSRRFTDGVFAAKWIQNMDPLMSSLPSRDTKKTA